MRPWHTPRKASQKGLGCSHVALMMIHMVDIEAMYLSVDPNSKASDVEAFDSRSCTHIAC